MNNVYLGGTCYADTNIYYGMNIYYYYSYTSPIQSYNTAAKDR